MIKLGFIGAGNMAGAIVRGVLAKKFLPAQNIFMHDVNTRQCEKMQSQYDIQIMKSNVDLVLVCNVIVLAIKPIFLKKVLLEIKPHVRDKKIISIATGWTTDMLRETLGENNGAQILRVMPNTPAMVGEGFTVLFHENSFDPEAFMWAGQLFQTLGQTEVLSERLLDAVIAVSGSSPAYVFLFIEAMTDGAVKLGIPRSVAYRAASQSVLGAAKMILETGEHPSKLKDDVCSPGGTTIEAVHALEQGGLRAAVINAMDACAQKSFRMTEEAKNERSVRISNVSR